MWRHAGRASGTQSKAESAVQAAPGRRTLVEAIQRAGGGEAPEAAVHAAAERGVATPGAALPFGHTIQQLFGRHDVSKVQAHTGSEAQASARAMNAGAYAMGDHVVLGDKADLHTVAHEAAHVVQQRAGVHLEGGVGAAGDAYEQHADAVADRVVRGESAEALLDAHAGGGGAAVQRKWIGNEEIGGVAYALWQQQKDDDEVREDGWYENDDGYWAYVGNLPKSSKKPSSRWDKEEDDDDSNKKKRKLEKEKVSEKEKAPEKPRKSRWGSDDEVTPKDVSSKKKTKTSKPKAKKPVLSDKIGYEKRGTFDPAFKLVTESEIGARVLASALENTDRVVFTLSYDERTQTHPQYGKSKYADRINISGGRALKGPGVVAQHLVMELTNLANKNRFWALDYQAQQGMPREDYVFHNELIEYEAARNVYGAWSAANKQEEGSWGECNYERPEVLESWTSWWAHLNQSCKEHLDHYRRAWATLVKIGADKIPPPPTQTVPLVTTTPTLPTPTPTQTDKDDEDDDSGTGVVIVTGGSSDKPFSLVDY